MSDDNSKTAKASYNDATPITYRALQENFEATIDRIVAGETFVLLVNGIPTIYMVPYEEYNLLSETVKKNL